MSGARAHRRHTIHRLVRRRNAMRNKCLVIAMSMVLAAATPLRAQPKGQRITVKGEVVDLWCYLEGGDRGPSKKQCATACAKAGNPIGILDSDGKLYVAAGLKDHQPAQTVLLNRMSDEVTAT